MTVRVGWGMGKWHAPGGCGSIPRELASAQVELAETSGSVHAWHGSHLVENGHLRFIRVKPLPD